MLRIAINGLGRIGRAVLRLALGDPSLEVVAVNDRLDARELGYLLRYDSVHGGLGERVESDSRAIRIDGREIRAYRRSEPLFLPWRRRKIDVVIEATGAFRRARNLARHRLAGARRTVVTANPQDGIPVVVPGVNEGDYGGEAFVSAGSCSVNAAGALLRILHEEFTLRSAVLTAIHAYTQDQRILDSGHPRDRRRGRAAACNTVPCRSDAAGVLARIVPGLNGRLMGSTVRVPVADGSIMNIVCELEDAPDAEALNAYVEGKAASELAGILAYSTEARVSRDVVGDTHSAVFDAGLTFGLPGSLMRVACWFDHEWGYAARVLDVAKLVAT